jgi:hypothetical protein
VSVEWDAKSLKELMGRQGDRKWPLHTKLFTPARLGDTFTFN